MTPGEEVLTADPTAGRDGIVLVGRPNVGKSALFAALTRRYVTVSNYPGTTVEITEGSTSLGGRSEAVLDTPGTCSFLPSSEDEKVTRDILLDRPPRVVLAVGDAKHLERAVTLALELGEMRFPCVLALNMSDEARQRGIAIDHEALGQRLGIEVVPTVAVQHGGLLALRRALQRPQVADVGLRYPEPIERALDELTAWLPPSPIASRALGLMVLAGDETLVTWLRERLDPPGRAAVEDIRQALRRRLRDPVQVVLQRARHRRARELSADLVRRTGSAERPARPLAATLERLSLHPIWSLPLLGAVLWLAYQFVGVFGAGTLVDLLENRLFGQVINPVASRWVESVVPWPMVRDLLVGPYGVLTMALTYSLALILPIVGTFFIAFGALEDSGYLPRLAVLLDRAFKKMGLNGKAVLPMVLGLGCGTMATLTTRMLPSKKERLIVIVLLSLGVPCSAQLTVILAMLAALSPMAVVLWLLVLGALIVVVGSAAARVLPGESTEFIVELPPLRLPRPGNILLKTAARIEWYLKEAVPLFVAGTLLLFAGDRLGLLEHMRRIAEPVVSGMLGLPRETAEAFIIGFLRRDFGTAGLYRMSEAGLLDPIQVLVAAVTITLFVPCIAHFFMTVRERGLRVGLAIAGFVFACALGVGSLLNLVLRALPFEVLG